VKRQWRLTLATSIALLGVSDIARSEEWKPVEMVPSISQSDGDSAPTRWVPVEDHPSTQSQSIQWQELTADPNHALPEAVVWTPVEPSVAAEIEQKIEEKAPIEDPANAAVAIQPPVMPSGTTFANHRALYRDDEVLPQISSLVPVGFGPQGLMLTGGIYGWDCTASGICSKPQSLGDYSDQIETFGEAHWESSLGLGDSEKLLGLTVTGIFEETSLPIGSRNETENKTLFSNYYFGFHLSRHIGPDTGLRIGVNNWLDVKECGLDCGYPKSAYGVISQRFRLKDDQNTWFPNAYLTLGVGNGEFRPLDEQVRSSIAAQRDAGCQTYGYIPDKPCKSTTLRRAVLDAANYGELTPIGAAALEVYPGFNAIGEWTGRNLNLGFSVKPFEEVGLVFTTMWNNLLQNCDYGCNINVPDYPDPVALPDNMITFRPVWSFNLSLNVNF